MRIIQKRIYKLEELSEDMQEKAREKFMADDPDGYHSSSEALGSLKALARHFNGELWNYNIDWSCPGHSFLQFRMGEMSEKEIRARLKELGSYNKRTGKGHGECKLTGMYFDENCIDGFRLAFRSGERDLTELMKQAGEELLSVCMHDYEYQQSMEAFKESCEANGYEFDEDGELV